MQNWGLRQMHSLSAPLFVFNHRSLVVLDSILSPTMNQVTPTALFCPFSNLSLRLGLPWLSVLSLRMV